jgi:hypothetical protein
VISGIGSSSITISGATIGWTTDEPATSQVEYGQTTYDGSSTTLDANLVTDHSVSLSGLNTSTTYHYRVQSRDASNKLAVSADNSFTTLSPPESTPPVISDVASTGITTSGATVSWTTNEPATGQVEYGQTSNYGSSSQVYAGLVTTHTVNLTGLTAGIAYHYRVKSKDASGNEASSDDRTFTTVAGPPAAPTLVSPANGASVPAKTVSFDWDSVLGAVKYKLVVSISTNILATNNYKFNVYLVGEATTTYVDTGYRANGEKYYWWVWAYAADGSCSVWSEVSANGRSFTCGIGTPSLVSPANGATVTGTSVAFQWSAVTGAWNYKLIVSTSSDYHETTKWRINRLVVYGTTYTDNGYLSNGTKYYWWVHAYAFDGADSVLSQVIANGRSFTNTA